MHSPHVYDTSAQAMTEVALGLSMAFFALLIVALLSFQMPAQPSDLNPAQTASTGTQAQQKVQLSQHSSQASSKADTSNSQFIFFYQGRFINQQGQPLTLNTLDLSTPVVLAVEQSLSFAEVIKLRHQINHPNLSITLLNSEWQRLLEQQQ